MTSASMQPLILLMQNVLSVRFVESKNFTSALLNRKAVSLIVYYLILPMLLKKTATFLCLAVELLV